MARAESFRPRFVVHDIMNNIKRESHQG